MSIGNLFTLGELVKSLKYIENTLDIFKGSLLHVVHEPLLVSEFSPNLCDLL